MGALKSTTNPNRYRRINRNTGKFTQPEQMITTSAVLNELGEVVTPEIKVFQHMPSRLVISWREWLTKEQRDLNETQEEIWHEDAGREYRGSQIILPPPGWLPNPNSQEDAVTQYEIATAYLTMQNDPEFLGIWIGDEV